MNINFSAVKAKLFSRQKAEIGSKIAFNDTGILDHIEQILHKIKVYLSKLSKRRFCLLKNVPLLMLALLLISGCNRASDTQVNRTEDTISWQEIGFKERLNPVAATWQKDLFNDLSVKELSNLAMKIYTEN